MQSPGLMQEQSRPVPVTELCLIEEEQRRRIATELHDHIGQSLALVKLKLGVLRGQASKELEGALVDIERLIDASIRQTRSLVFQITPPILHEQGLEPALRWLGELFQQEHGLVVSFASDERAKPMEEALAISLYQAARELLLNTVKHAQARRVGLSLSREDDQLCLSVEDDGIGFDPAQLEGTGHFGLQDLQRRIQALGGEIDIHSSPGGGTRVLLLVPVKSTPAEHSP